MAQGHHKLGWHFAELDLDTGQLIVRSPSDGPVTLDAREVARLLTWLYSHMEAIQRAAWAQERHEQEGKP